MSKLYRDHAIVLRTHPLGEADRIITLLTRHHGKVRAVAKGVRRTGSKFGARLEPFGVIDVQLHRGRSLDTITQAVTLQTFAQSICTDYAAFTAGSAILETTERLLDDALDPSEQGFLMLVGAMRTLASGRIPPPLVLDAYVLRMLALSGWAPQLRECASCGAAPPHFAIDIRAGGVVCESCRTSSSRAVRQAAIEHMIFLLAGNWDPVLAASAATAAEASRLISDTVTWHLERAVRSLHYVER